VQLLRKLLIAMAIPLAVIGAGSMAAVVGPAKRHLREEIEQRTRAQVATEASSVLSFVEARRSVLEVIARAPTVQSGDIPAIDAYLAAECRALAGRFDTLEYIDARNVVHPVGAEPRRLDDEQQKVAVATAQPLEAELAEIGPQHEPALAILLPVRSPDFGGRAAVVGKVRIRALADLLARSDGSDAFTCVMDEAGRVVLPRTPLTADAESTLASFLPLHQAVRARREGRIAFATDGRDSVAQYATIAPLGWTLSVVQPLDEVTVGERALLRTVLLSIGAAAVLAVASAAIASRTFLSPVATLLDAHRRFGMGEMDARVDVRGRDELAEVARSFNTMADQLVHAEARRAEAEAAERAIAERLAHAQKMESIGRLAGGIAHDFNNLLTVIVGLTDVLVRKANEGQRELLESVRQAAKQATALTAQLLAFARRAVVEPQVILVPTVLRDTEQLLSRLLPDDVVFRMVDGAPDACVRIDPAQLTQVLVNLAVNARDAMPQGGQLCVTVGRRLLDEAASQALGLHPGPHLVVSVSDTGHGLSKEARDHLFEPFFTSKARGRGTGLGLATAYGIISQAGGVLRLARTGAIGTEFEIVLPEAPPEACAPLATARPSVRLVGQSRRVLLVEDNTLVRGTVAAMLRTAAYDVSEASDGDEVLARVDELGGIDVVVTDVVMRHVGGLELAKRLRERHPGLKILFMSGDARDAAQALSGPLENAAFLAKPFGAPDLVEKLSRLLDGPDESAR
jgi:signal transduction histidine kinase/CheY-like chemotaxis protein